MLCKNILIIEDNDDIRDSVAEILKIEGYEVYPVANGKEGLRALKHLPSPTLILLDMMMPWMNGWEFTQALGKDPARESSSFIVVVSALNAEQALGTAEHPVPARGYIRKPIDLETLLDVVQTHCGLPGCLQTPGLTTRISTRHSSESHTVN